MDTKGKNTLLAAGIVSGLVSLPMTWMTIRNVEMQFSGGFGSLFNSAFQGMALDITGLNGHITLLFKAPIWFVIGVAIAANAIQLMRSSGVFAVPRIVIGGVGIVALIWLTIPVISALASGKATLGVGWLLGLFCAAAPLIGLFVSEAKGSESQFEAHERET